tara:strand:- start:34168 stop:35493 length:1326 start_codon:yes stop_codon:yes gene_type:complete
MKLGWLIFILAFFVRLFNLLFLDLNVDNYLVEDQKFYWNWSLKGAYLPWNEVPPILLTERMPGSFWFYSFLQWLTNNDLFFVLVIQSIIDSLTCVIIFLCAGLLNKSYKLYAGLFAALSPLMIIISSQILSDTIFLFTFSCSLYFLLKYWRSKNLKTYLYLSGLLLGVSTFIRAATFPLIFICLPIIYLIVKIVGNDYRKAFLSLAVFFLMAITPISGRWVDNIINYDTYSLTSQSGTHVAYWMVPGVLSVSKGMDRKSSLNIVNLEINKFGGITNEPYKDSSKRISVSIDILKKEKFYHISYAWLRSSIINIISSPILIDYRVRSLAHPSFAQEGNIKKWVKTLFLDKQYLLYLIVLIFSLIFSLFSIYSIVLGYYFFLKSNLFISFISILLIIYFCLITGPTISPKYCLPYLPVLIYLQAISLDKLILFIKNRAYRKTY